MDDQIEKLAGVSKEQAFAFDKINLYQKLGHATFVKLSTVFYEKVFNDSETWFRNIFHNSNKEEAIQNQYEFFIQRMGGPPLYSNRKGHPALIGRHAKFNMNGKAARRWLELMQTALDEVDEIDQESATLMMNFFKHTAFFLSLGVRR